MNVAKYLVLGDHKVAREFMEQAWQTWQRLFGEEDQQTRLMAWWLSFVYLKVGRYDDASQLVAQLKDVYSRTAPADRKDTREDALETLNLEAAVRRVQGDFAAGAELDEAAYDRARRAFGEDDPTTLVTAHNLGVSLRLVGDFQRALELDQHARRRPGCSGRDHQQSLITEASIAVDVRETGDYVGARSLQQAVVDGFRTVFGAGNPATLATVRQLSEACRKEGDPEGALELAREAFDQFARRYGDTHPESLTASLTLSVALRHNGELERAADLGEKASGRFRELFQPDHPHALAADIDLAVTLRLLGRVREARQLHETALESLTGRLGESHPIALACAINLASDLSALGLEDKARELGEKTLELCQDQLGEDHPTTLVCAANLSLDRIAVGQRTDGEALRAATLERMERCWTDLGFALPSLHLTRPRCRLGRWSGPTATSIRCPCEVSGACGAPGVTGCPSVPRARWPGVRGSVGWPADRNRDSWTWRPFRPVAQQAGRCWFVGRCLEGVAQARPGCPAGLPCQVGHVGVPGCLGVACRQQGVALEGSG